MWEEYKHSLLPAPCSRKNLMLCTGRAGKLTNDIAHTQSEFSQCIPIPSASGTCKLFLELFSYSLSGPQICLQFSVFHAHRGKVLVLWHEVGFYAIHLSYGRDVSRRTPIHCKGLDPVSSPSLLLLEVNGAPL